jgi:hypothetical protein
MSKRQDKQSDEATLALTTAMVLREHLTSHGSLKQASEGVATLNDALKPFEVDTQENAHG